MSAMIDEFAMATNANVSQATDALAQFEERYTGALQTYEQTIQTIDAEIAEEDANTMVLQAKISELDAARVAAKVQVLEEREADLKAKYSAFQDMVDSNDALLAQLGERLNTVSPLIESVKAKANGLATLMEQATSFMAARKRAFGPALRPLYNMLPLIWRPLASSSQSVKVFWPVKDASAVREVVLPLAQAPGAAKLQSVTIDGVSVPFKATQLRAVDPATYDVSKQTSTFPAVPGVTAHAPAYELTVSLSSDVQVAGGAAVVIELAFSEPVSWYSFSTHDSTYDAAIFGDAVSAASLSIMRSTMQQYRDTESVAANVPGYLLPVAVVRGH